MISFRNYSLDLIERHGKPEAQGDQALPFVSVCLLTYKRAHLLAATLDSILQQTHGHFELLINDDNSPDDTETVARLYESRDRRVRYYRNAINLRYAGNQNAALGRARSDYVAFLHDGDIYRPDLLEKWTHALSRQPTAALVFNSLEEMDLSGRVIRVHRHRYGQLVSGRTLLQEMLGRSDSPIFGIVMVRKSCVESVGPFSTDLPTLADVDMWMRLLARYDAAYVAEPLIRIAAREKDHANRIGNWRVRHEHESIYAMNLPRAFAGARSRQITNARRRAVRMLWRQRLFWLAWCTRHMRIRAICEGIIYCFRNPSPIPDKLRNS